MLDRIADIIKAAEEKGLPIDKKTLQDVVENLFLGHIVTTVIRCVTGIIIAAMICYTATLL